MLAGAGASPASSADTPSAGAGELPVGATATICKVPGMSAPGRESCPACGREPQGYPSCMQPCRAVFFLLLHLILDLHLCFPVSELICKPQSRNKHFNQHSSPSEPATQVKQTDCGIVVNDVDNFNNSKGETDCFPLLLMSLIRSRLDKMICCVFMNLRLAAGKDNNLWIFQLNWRTPYHHPLTHPPNHPSTHPRTAAPSGLIIIIFTPPLSIFR